MTIYQLKSNYVLLNVGILVVFYLIITLRCLKKGPADFVNSSMKPL